MNALLLVVASLAVAPAQSKELKIVNPIAWAAKASIDEKPWRYVAEVSEGRSQEWLHEHGKQLSRLLQKRYGEHIATIFDLPGHTFFPIRYQDDQIAGVLLEVMIKEEKKRSVKEGDW